MGSDVCFNFEIDFKCMLNVIRNCFSYPLKYPESDTAETEQLHLRSSSSQ